jgi:ABC-type uncharacterized transport system substrate-binding protein
MCAMKKVAVTSIVVIVVMLAVAVIAEAQQPTKVPRIGFLVPGSASGYASLTDAFRQGLRDLGYVEGKNIIIEYRYTEGKLDPLPELAADLVRLKVDVIVTASTPDALATKQRTGMIPIVMAVSGDPLGSGLVASLARPGRNVTGLTSIASDLSGKRLELLKDGPANYPIGGSRESLQRADRLHDARNRSCGPGVTREGSNPGSARS